LSGRGCVYKIRPETEQAIFETARRLGYTHGHNVFKPKPLRTRTLGLLIPDLSHFFLGRLARTIVSRAAASGLSVLVCDTLEDTDTEIQQIEQLLDRDIDGLLILPVGKEWDHIARLSTRPPGVVVDRIVPMWVHCVEVATQGRLRGVEHWIESGYRGSASSSSSPFLDQLLNGLGKSRVHARHGIAVETVQIIGDLYGQQNAIWKPSAPADGTLGRTRSSP
jgi:DNA-binding LacI/PurR family transcriptional regulator